MLSLERAVHIWYFAPMGKLTLFCKLFPFLAFLYWGIFSILEVFFPSLRDPDFNRWEVDEVGGTYIEIAGWKKMLTPPRVIAQGYVSNTTACRIAIVAGVICILIAVFGIRHVSGFPGFLPDLLSSF
jgi:hypothetical protein